MNYDNIKISRDNAIGLVTINRPDKLNALNRKTIQELNAAFAEMQEDKSIRVVILTGAGEKAFVAGADIKELSELDEEQGKEYVLEGQELTKMIENSAKPVIAAINGFALGGGTELALCCHIRIASKNARMGQPEVKLGLIPGFGGTQRLPRLAGKGAALELILSGEVIDADEAFRIGLVNRVVEPNELMPTCQKLAAAIISNAPVAVAKAIKAVIHGLDKTLPEALILESELFGECCRTQDSKEGTRAFLEKRKADFKGK
jgi:enoyl-CoA hydratase